ncbi:MAG: DNA double-strand break repair nuclease NurA [Nitrososphaerota archaeon]|nr:DNA double-strand break repair nuclease NurA [Nitrososphaerota archaeon]
MFKLSNQINFTSNNSEPISVASACNEVATVDGEITSFQDQGDELMGAMSIDYLNGQKIIFDIDEDKEIRPLDGWEGELLDIEFNNINSEGLKENLVGIDSSALNVAETESGSVYAVKAAASFLINSKRKYYRLGPFIAYIGPNNIGRIRGIVGARLPAYMMVADKQIAMGFLRSYMEAMTIGRAARALGKGIVMVDGALKSPSFGPSSAALAQVMNRWKENIKFMGISKTTHLRPIRPFYSALARLDGMKYADITEVINSISHGEYGRKYLVKFTDDGFVFRVDLPYGLEPDLTFASLKRSEVMSNGYPESLKIAHLLSIFSNAELMGVRGKVASRASKVLFGEDIRRVLLGSLHIR